MKSLFGYVVSFLATVKFAWIFVYTLFFTAPASVAFIEAYWHYGHGGRKRDISANFSLLCAGAGLNRNYVNFWCKTYLFIWGGLKIKGNDEFFKINYKNARLNFSN